MHHQYCRTPVKFLYKFSLRSKTTMEQKLIVIMLDGFRWDYIARDKDHLPNFTKLKSEGVHFEHLEPIFPVLSYPNWTTMVTGVYADQHGITGNYMWDKSQKTPSQRTFELMKQDTTKHLHWWEHAPEPIWITASKAGLRTFTRCWSRSDLPYDGVSAEESSCFEERNSFQNFIDVLNTGFQKLQNGFQFIMLYEGYSDYSGHLYGPESEAMRKAVRDMDLALGDFLQKIDGIQSEMGIGVNIVILSDHGMTSAGPQTSTVYVNLDDYITEDDVEAVVDYGPYLCIATYPETVDIVVNKLRNIDGAIVYQKDDIPEEWNLRHGRFMLDVLVGAKPGFFIRGLPGSHKQIPSLDAVGMAAHWEGVHGYLTDLKDQHGILVARGPALKQNLRLPPISMVDVYQIFTELLGIKAHAHSGDWSRVEAMFNKI